MLTSALSRLLTLTLLLFGASNIFADICEDYARVIDTHIAMLRVVEKRANAVADSKQAVDRAVFEMDQGNVENAPPLCQKAIERFNFFAKEDLDLAEKLGDLLVKYISDPAVVSAWRRMQDLPHR